MQDRKTKIVATIGPASGSPAMLGKLIDEGIDAARLNLSHGDHLSHGRIIRDLRRLAAARKRPIAIIADLQGPKLRIGDLPREGVELREGEMAILDTARSSYRDGIIPLPSLLFKNGIETGHTVFLDDGLLQLKIISKKGSQFRTQVVKGGRLQAHKGVNVPALSLRRSSLEAKDKADVAFAVRAGVDYVALSFIRQAADIDSARRLLKGLPIGLIAKIERPEALEHIDAIAAAADVVMVARGDLGIETPLWELPVRQKEIVEKVRRRMKPVIVATQMLDSMIRNPLPTRAEVSDVANAVFDSADAVMLSGETASGAYPVEAVRMMRRVLEATEEKQGAIPDLAGHQEYPPAVAVARSAKYIAAEIGASAILAGTVTGTSARLVSHFRPETPIVALSSDPRVARQLALAWGIVPMVVRHVRTIDQLSNVSIRHLVKGGRLKTGDRVVFISGKCLGRPGQTNTLAVNLVA